MALRDTGRPAGKTGGEFAAGPGTVEGEISRSGLNVKSLASVDTQLI